MPLRLILGYLPLLGLLRAPSLDRKTPVRTINTYNIKPKNRSCVKYQILEVQGVKKARAIHIFGLRSTSAAYIQLSLMITGACTFLLQFQAYWGQEAPEESSES